MRKLVILTSAIGVLVFVSGLVFSFKNPLTIESAAREIVRIEIEHRVGERIDTLSNSKVIGFAQKALSQTNQGIEQVQDELRRDVPKKVAAVVGEMLKADCECRKRLAEGFQQFELSRLSSLNDVRDRLTQLVESSYASVTKNLFHEFRIFCVSNAFAFALLGVVAWLKRGATLQLLLPTIAILGAVSVTAFMYIFKQDWLHTIVFSDYVGYGYCTYLTVVILLFADILINRARITAALVNGLLSAVGSSLSALPC